jgi:hypothetical protein
MRNGRLLALPLLLILALIPACSSGPDEAEGAGGAVQRFYGHLNDGDYAAAKDLYNQAALELLNDPDFSTDDSFREWAQGHTKNGTISAVTIVGSEELDSGETRVEFQISYEDGSTTSGEVTATLEDGEWKLGLLG